MGLFDRIRQALAPAQLPAQEQHTQTGDTDPNLIAKTNRGRAGGAFYSTSAMYNAVTGAGTARDPSFFNAWALPRPLLRQERFGMGRNALIQQALGKLPATATREGWRVLITDENVEDPGAVANQITAYEERLGLNGKVNRALFRGRQHSQAMVVLAIDDWRGFEREVDVESIRTIKWAAVIDSRDFQPDRLYSPTSEHYGEIETFEITDVNGFLEDGLRYGPDSVSFDYTHWSDIFEGEKKRQGGRMIVHASRVMFFPTADYLPMLDTIQDALGAYFESMSGIRTAAREASMVKYKISNWLRKQWSENAALASVHMALIDRAKGVMNAFVVDKDNEDVEIVNRSLSGVPKMGDPFMVWLAAALEIPVTVLWGVSPGGFGKGEAERETWHETARAFQTHVITSPLTQVHGYILAAADGPQLPADTQRKIEYNDLSPPDEKVRADLRSTALGDIRQLHKDDLLSRGEAREAVAKLEDEQFQVSINTEIVDKPPPAPVGIVTGGIQALQAAYPLGIPLGAIRAFFLAVDPVHFTAENISRIVPEPEPEDAPTPGMTAPELGDEEDIDEPEEPNEIDVAWANSKPPEDSGTSKEIAKHIPLVTGRQVTLAAKKHEFPAYRGLGSKPLYSLAEVKRALLVRNGSLPSAAFPVADEASTQAVYVYLKAPQEIARWVPFKKQDTSPPHVTLVYVKNVPPSRAAGLIDELIDTLADLDPLQVQLSGGVDYFDTKPDVLGLPQSRVAYAKVDFDVDTQELQGDLVSAVESFGLEASTFGRYKPHITLEYIDDHSDYHGPVPTGNWTATEAVICYGDEQWVAPFLGKDYSQDALTHAEDDATRDKGPLIKEGWIWRTQKDSRVRSKHRDLRGKRYRFGTEHPSEGEPGDAVNCRCAKEIILRPNANKRARNAAKRTTRRALRLRYESVTGAAQRRAEEKAQSERDASREPTEDTIKLWLAEHVSDARKMPRNRMRVLKNLENKYPYLAPPKTELVYRGLRNVKRSSVGRLIGFSNAVFDKSWTTDKQIAAKFASTEWTSEEVDDSRVGVVLVAVAEPKKLLLNYELLAELPGVADRYHDRWEQTLKQAILDEKEVLALSPLYVRTASFVEMATLPGVGEAQLVSDELDQLTELMLKQDRR